jgi:nitroreductase/Fe-S-cluster-containing hydrogenase component 2
MAKKEYGAVIAPAGRAGRPIIDIEKCNGCGLCVSICPLGALEIKDKKAVPVVCMRMGDSMEVSCFGCRDCIAVCPEDAIEVEGSVVIDEGLYRSQFPDRKLSPPEPLGPGKNFSEIQDQLTEVERVIFRRRSNRIFKKNPVPQEMIERILEAGRYGPSAGNNQPIRYIVISDTALIEQIEEGVLRVLKRLSKGYREGGLLVRSLLHLYGLRNPQDMDIRPIYALNALMREGSRLALFHHAPCVILMLSDQRGVGDYKLDCGIAAQNIVLAAHSLGLGTCYVGFIKPINMIGGLKKKLGIEYPYQVVTSIALGYPRVKQDKEVIRERTPITWFGPGKTGSE